MASLLGKIFSPHPLLRAWVTNALLRACFPGTHEAPSGTGAMKNIIDHCSAGNKSQNMKICVFKWASDGQFLGSGARAAARQGVKNENPGRGGGNPLRRQGAADQRRVKKASKLVQQ